YSMGGVTSSPRFGVEVRRNDTAEYLLGQFVGEKSLPLVSDYWQKLLALPLDLPWESDRVIRACQLLAMNNCSTRHLAKILIHLAWCLQDCVSSSHDPSSPAFSEALNAVCISSVFLKFLIEESNSDCFEELHLSLDDTETLPNNFSEGKQIESLIMHNVLKFIGTVDVSIGTYLLHQELLNFILIATSTQLLSGPSPGPNDIHPFTDAAMAQEITLVNAVVQKMLLNYINKPHYAPYISFTPWLSEGNETGVKVKVGFAGTNMMQLPFNYLVSIAGEGSSPLAEASLYVLLILINYRKCAFEDHHKDKWENDSSESVKKEEACFYENPFCKALENARDTEFDRNDTEGNAHFLPLVRVPFTSLLDSLGSCLSNENSVMLLYSLVHSNSNFLEYVFVRSDVDTL
ncbi:hypothetical protein M569_10824, partial [Genlisea aurea]